jgi:2,3-bisphosphoglycerate-dependent phosphoglycerate mutase
MGESMEQKWPSHLVIVRHGESERNVAKDAAKQGTAIHSFGSGLRDMDTKLTPRGHRQARAVGEHLAAQYRFDVLFSSPYLRTMATSEEIASKLTGNPPLVVEERIREIEFGVLEGLTSDGMKTKYADEYARREKEGKYWYRPPGGESRPDVALRVQSFLGTLTRDYREKSVLIVCHSVVVLIFRRLLERWREDDYLKVDQEADVLNCSLTTYDYDVDKNKLLLNAYNAICYTDSD